MLPIELVQGNKLSNFIIMKIIQLILAIILALCAIIMFYGTITTHSPIKTISIIIMGIICIGCFAFVRITYTELCE